MVASRIGKSAIVPGMNSESDRQESSARLRMDEQARIEWARKIKPARLAKGLTQGDLAEMSGVAIRTIGNIETGKMVPQDANLRKLMMALDLLDDPADDYPDWVSEWLAVIGPLIQQIPQPPRNAVMTDVVVMLASAIKDSNVTAFPQRAHPSTADVEPDWSKMAARKGRKGQSEYNPNE